MADQFLELTPEDRREALLFAADATGRPAYLLEKDVWVVWTLNALFDSPFGDHLVFKGGTSLSKCCDGLIKRFSEDIDLTYDIRELIGDVIGDPEREPIPPSGAQEKKWTKAVRERLPAWIAREVLPHLSKRIKESGLDLTLRPEGDKVYIDYSREEGAPAYVSPWVLLEFGARSTGEPAEHGKATCDAAPALPALAFPEASPRFMDPRRTFWEKATAVHVFCLAEEINGRAARHWYDLYMMDRAGIADDAIESRDIATAVADHKQAFFSEKDASKNRISYAKAIGGQLVLVPTGKALLELEHDYQEMIDGGLFEGEPVPMADILACCADIQGRANAKAGQP